MSREGLSLTTRLLRLSSKADSAMGMLRAPLIMRRLERRNRSSTAPVTGTAPAVVSLTTYGGRLQRVHLVVESIAAGRVRPQRLLLWLDEDTDPGTLPVQLERLRDRGLEIRFTRDLGPYKKFYPALGELAPDQFLVTADDDVLYPQHWLARLIAAATATPSQVHCFRSREARFDNDGFAAYGTWPLNYSTTPSFRHFPTGVSGVIYPPRMTSALRERGDAFLATAPRADDIWLHHTAVRTGLRVHQLSRLPRHFPELPGSQSVSLFSSNLRQGGNDPQLAATYTAEDIALIRAEPDG